MQINFNQWYSIYGFPGYDVKFSHYIIRNEELNMIEVVSWKQWRKYPNGHYIEPKNIKGKYYYVMSDINHKRKNVSIDKIVSILKDDSHVYYTNNPNAGKNPGYRNNITLKNKKSNITAENAFKNLIKEDKDE